MVLVDVEDDVDDEVMAYEPRFHSLKIVRFHDDPLPPLPKTTVTFELVTPKSLAYVDSFVPNSLHLHLHQHMLHNCFFDPLDDYHRWLLEVQRGSTISFFRIRMGKDISCIECAE